MPVGDWVLRHDTEERLREGAHAALACKRTARITHLRRLSSFGSHGHQHKNAARVNKPHVEVVMIETEGSP